MKRKIIFSGTLIACILCLTAFALKKESKKKDLDFYYWWDFNGGYSDQTDPSAYSLDANNWPDCPPQQGLIRCEILAPPSEFNPDEPDLSAVQSQRMKLN